MCFDPAIPNSTLNGSISTVDVCLMRSRSGPTASSIRLAFTQPPSTFFKNGIDGAPSIMNSKCPAAYEDLPVLSCPIAVLAYRNVLRRLASGSPQRGHKAPGPRQPTRVHDFEGL